MIGLTLLGGSAPRVHAANGQPPELQRNAVSVDGQNRDYYYFVPRNVDPRGFNLVVYALQDDHESVQQFAQRSGWLQVAQKNGFVVVFPQAQYERWLTDAGNEDDYLKAVFEDAKTHMWLPWVPPARGPAFAGGEGAGGPPGAVPPVLPVARRPMMFQGRGAHGRGGAGPRRGGAGVAMAPPIGQAHSWLPFQYLSGEGAGATLALTFAMNHPDLFAAVATLNGAPYAQAYHVANQSADGSTLRMWTGWDVWASWEPSKKDVPVAVWLFTSNAPKASQLEQIDYWKHADGVGPGRNETIDGFRTAVYQNASNPSEQVRTSEVPPGTKFDATMASVVWDRLFSHVARWTDDPNGRLGRLLTRQEVNQQFKIRNVTIDGQNYVYYLSLPPSYRTGEHLPLVVCAHGGDYPAWLYLSQLKMQDVGRKEGFITAYLQEPAYFWHFMDPDGADARFIQKVVADVESSFGADRHRVYMQGFSLGSGMTYMMGITHPQLFAAVSPNSGIGPMSPPVEARVAAIKSKADIRMPVIIMYGNADHGGSIDGQLPAGIGVLEPALREWKAFDHITTPDRSEPYDSPSSPPYDVLVPGAKLVRGDVSKHYPDGRLSVYEYDSDDPHPLNLLDFVWVKDMAHSQFQGEAQMQWDFFKHWSRNDNGSLTYAP
ncbi:MAG TPA: PHB depolymerase family esterase [Steroidobacteraceae bacterium]